MAAAISEAIEPILAVSEKGFLSASEVAASADEFVSQFTTTVQAVFNASEGAFQQMFSEMFEGVKFDFAADSFEVCAGECSEAGVKKVPLGDFNAAMAPFNLGEGKVGDIIEVFAGQS